jgi:hypothetical protein
VIFTGGSSLRVQSPALAQQLHGFIAGKITDAQSGEPLPDVNVVIVGTRLGRATDSQGGFVVGPLEHDSVVIECSHVAYETVRDTIRLRASGFIVTHNVKMSRRIIMLDQVEITGKSPDTFWKGTGGRRFTRKHIQGTGVRRLGDLIRLMTPGAYVFDLGPDLFIDLYRSSRRTPRSPFRDIQQNNPLIILNGMRIGKSPLALNSLIKTEEIDEIVILKGLEAEMYGYEGRDGVILVTTTPEPPPTDLSLIEKLLYVGAVAGASLLISLLVF